MSLKDKLTADLKAALLQRDERRKSVIRLALAAVKNAEIAQRRELDDEGTLAVLRKEVNQRKDSIAEFEKGGRQDLVDAERAEMEILLGYLPTQLSVDEIRELARATIAEVGATSPRDIGKVMPAVLGKAKGRADGKLVNQVVRDLLAGVAGEDKVS